MKQTRETLKEAMTATHGEEPRREKPKPTRHQRRWVDRAMSRHNVRGPAGLSPSTSQCRCGDAFVGRTSREAIAKRKRHEADAHR